MARTCFVLTLDGMADGPVGITLDVLGAVTRLSRSGLVGKRERQGELVPRLVSLDGRPVRTAAGRTATVDGALGDIAPTKRDVLLVPGLGTATEPEVDRALAREDVKRAVCLLGALGPRVGIVAASCASTFLLAASGLLEGHAATTTWWLAPVFAKKFPSVTLRSDRMVVASEATRGPARLTAGSAFAHADLVLSIVARTCGPSLAQLAASYLVLDERTSQSRYMVQTHLRASDPVVSSVERYVLANLEGPLALADLARAARTSPRTLARRVSAALGITPLRFVHRLKMERAAHLLEASHEPVDAIARSVGYADPAAFRRIFRRELGRSPRELRAPPS